MTSPCISSLAPTPPLNLPASVPHLSFSSSITIVSFIKLRNCLSPPLPPHLLFSVISGCENMAARGWWGDGGGLLSIVAALAQCVCSCVKTGQVSFSLQDRDNKQRLFVQQQAWKALMRSRQLQLFLEVRGSRPRGATCDVCARVFAFCVSQKGK